MNAMDEKRPTVTEPRGAHDDANWAKPVQRLTAAVVPEGATDLIEGKRLLGPVQGFGQLWQRTYRVRLDGTTLTPREVIAIWKERFPSFWPRGNRFYAPITGIEPGEVALLQLAVAGPVRLSTGVMVLYADDESFTLMTPQGHMFAGWITFSAAEDEGATVAQTQVLLRTQDPLIELSYLLGASRMEDRFWERTLEALAEHFGARGVVSKTIVCVDPRWQWSRATNVWYNVGIRNTLHALAAPIRRLFRTPRP